MTTTMVNEAHTACNAAWDLPFLPDTASLVPAGGGWVYSDGGRTYRLEGGEGPGAACRGLLEAWCSGRYACRWADWSIALERAEVARLLAQDDAELETSIRQDIFRLRLAIITLRIRVEIDAIDCEPDLPEPWGVEARDEADLLIVGLAPQHRRTIARAVRKLGGRAFERRAS
jgi:hypothetical protein